MSLFGSTNILLVPPRIHLLIHCGGLNNECKTTLQNFIIFDEKQDDVVEDVDNDNVKESKKNK